MYPSKELVRRAIANARPNDDVPCPRWAAVCDRFGMGSTYATELCRQYGFDPHEEICKWLRGEPS